MSTALAIKDPTVKLIEIVLENQKEQAKSQQEQAKAQQEQAKAQQEQAKAQQLFQATVLREFKITQDKLEAVESKLENIEKHTVEIKGILLSEFQNIDQQLKEELVQAFEEGMAAPETVEQIEGIKNGTPVKVVKNGKVTVKKYPTIKALVACEEYFGKYVKSAYRSEPGKFVARVIRQLTGVDFKGDYPLSLGQAIAISTYFYQTSYQQPQHHNKSNIRGTL